MAGPVAYWGQPQPVQLIFPDPTQQHGFGQYQQDIDERQHYGYGLPCDITQPPPPVVAAPTTGDYTMAECQEKIEMWTQRLKSFYHASWQSSNVAALDHEREQTRQNQNGGGRVFGESSSRWRADARNMGESAAYQPELNRRRQNKSPPPGPTNHMTMKLQAPQNANPVRRPWGEPGRNKNFQKRRWHTPYRRMGERERNYQVKTRLLVRLHKEKCPPDESFKCKIVEKNGDIITSPEIFKAIPVAADFAPTGGLAKQVLDVFGQPEDASHARPGQVLQRKTADNQTWLFLVTAQRSYHRPNANLGSYLQNVETALDNLAGHIKANEIAEIAVPYLCSGRGRLNWLFMKDLLMNKLQDVAVTVVVYHLSKTAPTKGQRPEASSLRRIAPVVVNPRTGNENREAETHTLNLSLPNQVTLSEENITIESTVQTINDAPGASQTSPATSPLQEVESPTTDSECRDEEIHTLNPSTSNQATQSAGSTTSPVPQAEHSTTPRRVRQQQRRQHGTRSQSAVRARWCRLHLVQNCPSCYDDKAPERAALVLNGNNPSQASAPPTDSF